MAAFLAPDLGVRTESAGRVLLGGHPFRVLRLSAGGARRVASWFAGESEPNGDEEVALAKRLVMAGLAHPRPSAATLPCHVVIPFHGADKELQTTLAPLRVSGAASITVVDDGSQPPVGPINGITVLRHDRSRGPAAARNTGWRHVASTSGDSDSAVLFLDGGVVVPSGSNWFDALSGHLVDADVAAVAPRVASTPGPSAIEQFEERFSPLDLGPSPSLVGPGRLVTYVPTACLMVRLSDLEQAHGFDEALRYGEDVDLIWRLSGDRQVRYDPSVVVQHEPRQTLGAFASQRFHYATAAAALDHRHPAASAPWQSSLVGVAGVALVSIGRPFTGALVGLGPVTLLAEQLTKTATPTATSLRLLGAGHRWAMRSFAECMGRSWLGFAMLTAAVPALRAASVGWMLAGWMRRATTTRSPRLLLLGIVDDASYGAGAVAGAVRHRSVRSLLPKISRWG